MKTTTLLRPLLIMALMTAAATAQMDDSLGGYTAMEIEAGIMRGNFATGAIDEMSGGVRIRLLSDDPALAALPIHANTMRFTWVEGRTTPTTIIMEQNVRVEHPDASITAERAEWNFQTGELVFSGNPVVNSERLEGLRGEKMILNIEHNTFEVTRVRADQVPLQVSDAAAPRTPAEGIRARDITNWGQLIDTIKAQATADAPTPGRQLLAQMSEQNQQLLLTLDTDTLVARTEDMTRLLNSVLANPGLYDEDAWASITLPEEARALLAEDSLDSGAHTRLNRMLLEAAYPFAFE